MNVILYEMLDCIKEIKIKEKNLSIVAAVGVDAQATLSLESLFFLIINKNLKKYSMLYSLFLKDQLYSIHSIF